MECQGQTWTGQNLSQVMRAGSGHVLILEPKVPSKDGS